MADDQATITAKIWAEVRLWFPRQSDRIEGDKILKRGAMKFLASIPPKLLTRAWARIKARPTVYASDSIPALFTQAIGDEAASLLGGPDDFEGWVRSVLRRGADAEATPPSELYAEAMRLCPDWYTLRRCPSGQVSFELKPGRDYVARAIEQARVQTAISPASVNLALKAPEWAVLPEKASALTEEPRALHEAPEAPHTNSEAAQRGLAKIREVLRKANAPSLEKLTKETA